MSDKVRILFDDWFILLEYCNNGSPDKKQFKTMVDKWAKMWSRLSMADQGECSHEIHNRLIG